MNGVGLYKIVVRFISGSIFLVYFGPFMDMIANGHCGLYQIRDNLLLDRYLSAVSWIMVNFYSLAILAQILILNSSIDIQK